MRASLDSFSRRAAAARPPCPHAPPVILLEAEAPDVRTRQLLAPPVYSNKQTFLANFNPTMKLFKLSSNHITRSEEISKLVPKFFCHGRSFENTSN